MRLRVIGQAACLRSLPNKLNFVRPVQGAEFAEGVVAKGEGKAAQVSQKAERATLGRAVPGAQARAGEAAMAVVEELAAEPGADAAGNFSAFATEDVGEFAQDEVGVDPGLGFEIAGVGFAVDFAFAFVEEERGLDAVGDFLDEGDKRGDVAFVERLAGVVRLEFSDDRARIEDGDVERIARLPKEGSAAGSEVRRAFSSHAVEHGATAFADEARFQVDRNGSVGALEQRLDFPEECHNRVTSDE